MLISKKSQIEKEIKSLKSITDGLLVISLILYVTAGLLYRLGGVSGIRNKALFLTLFIGTIYLIRGIKRKMTTKNFEKELIAVTNYHKIIYQTVNEKNEKSTKKNKTTNRKRNVVVMPRSKQVNGSNVIEFPSNNN